MQLRFLGGAREIGRSALLIDESLLLDYGMSTDTPPKFPVGDVSPDAVVVSHGHLDHVGAVPALMAGDERPTVHWTPPTRDLAGTLARDTLKLHGVGNRGTRAGSYACPFTDEDLKRLTEASETHGYREPFTAAGYAVTLFNAGHVPGSAHILVSEEQSSSGSRARPGDDDGETRLLYTSDFYAVADDAENGEGVSGDDGREREHADSPDGGDGIDAELAGQRLVAPSTARPEADVVVTEATYADRIHPDRRALERRFAESVRTTRWEGGTVVVPAFAVGRTQEMLLVCEAFDIDCYVDGMGTEVTRQFRRYPDFVRDPEALRGAKASARFVDGRDGQRRRIAEDAVVITTSGMLQGGPAMTYVPAIRANPTNKITLTGHQVAGTPGRRLLDSGRAEIDGRVMPVSAQVESYDFSAHADRDGLDAFLDSYRDATVLVNHGDRCATYAAELREDGFDAHAPELGATVEV